MADDNVRLFPRMGAADPPADPPADPLAEVDPDPDPVPEADPGEAPAARRRRSPLETLAALGDPADPAPSESTEPLAGTAPIDGEVSAAFRSETWGGDQSAQALPDPGLGALSLAAVLAVSVAALRGIHGALTGLRANREQRQTVADLAASGRGDGQGNRRGSIPSSQEFGRRSLGRDRAGNRQGGGFGSFFGGGNRGGGSRPSRRNTGGGGGGGFIGGGGSPSRRRSSPSSTGSSSGSGPGSRKSGGSRSSAGSGTGSGSGRSGKTGSGSGKTGSGSGSSSGGSGSTGGSRGPRRTSQGAGWWRRKKKPTSSGPSGSSGGSGPSGSTSTGGTGTPKTGPKAGPKGGRKGGPTSPRTGTAPKGTLRSKRPKGAGGAGAPGVGAPGGPPPRKRHGKPVTDGSMKLPKGISHGHLDGWNQGCRCAACTRAWAMSQTRIGKKEKLAKGIRHGSAPAFEDAECRCKKCVRAAIRRRDTEPRVTLGRAIGNTFERRWTRRTRTGVTPPLLSTESPKARRKAAKKKAAEKKKHDAAAAASTGPKVDLGKTPGPGGPGGTTPPPGSSSGSSGPGAGRPGPSGPGSGRHRRTPGGGSWSRERRRSYERAAGPRPAEDEFWFTFGPEGVRRMSPWEAAAAASAGPEVITKVEQLNKPGDTRRRETAPADPLGLPTTPVVATPAAAAAEPPAKEPSAGAPIPEQRGAGMTLPASATPGAVHMAAQHDTEVTIDDVLDVLGKLTSDSFTAHEKSIVIAEQARAIRNQLEELAAELQVHHNVIGRRTGAAMARLAESMDVLANKADEMRTASLNAAEESESTEHSMADEHRPVQQATADQNLVVPSARIHNEG